MMKKLLIIWLALVAAVYGAELGTIGLYDELAIPVDGVTYEGYGLTSADIGTLDGSDDVVTPSEASSYGEFDYDALMFMLLSRNSSVLVPFEIDGVTYYLPDLTVTEPTTNYPASFADFAPPVDDRSPSDLAPQIAKYTVRSEADDTMAMTGEGMNDDSFGTIFWSKDEMGFGYLQDNREERQAVVTLPSGLTADDAYFLWPVTTNGAGRPVVINVAEAWWVENNKVATNELFSIIGVNLLLGDGDAQLYCSTTDEWLTPVESNPYRSIYRRPPSWADGTTNRVYAHNGHGKEYGWSYPLDVICSETITYGYGNIIDVTDAAYGATGDGVTDDYAALVASRNALADGDVWYFPAGTYAMSEGLILPTEKNIEIKGDGTNLTTITSHPDAVDGEVYIIEADSTHFLDGSAMHDLTIAVGPYAMSKIIEFEYAQDSIVYNCHFTQLNSTNNVGYQAPSISLKSSNFITVSNCTFVIGAHVWIANSDDFVMTDCDTYGIWQANALFVPWGGDKQLWMNNRNFNYDNSDPLGGAGWATGRWIAGNTAWGTMDSYYYEGNSTHDLDPPINGDQNQGEDIMFEGGRVVYLGNASSIFSNGCVLANWIGTSSAEQHLIIHSGKGMGQGGLFTSQTNGTCVFNEIGREWRVTPDETSVFSAPSSTYRHIVYDNHLDGTQRAVTNDSHIASSGVEWYGGGTDHVVANNLFTDIRYAVNNFVLDAEYTEIIGGVTNEITGIGQQMLFCSFVDNVMSNCMRGICPAYAAVDPDSDYGGGGFVGELYRNNIEIDSYHASFRASGCYTNYGTLIIDGNTFDSLDAGIIDTLPDQDLAGSFVFVGNAFNGVGSEIEIANSNYIFNANTWNGFADERAPLTSRLQLPVRIYTTNSEAQVCNVYNQGVKPLEWSTESGAGGILAPDGVTNFTFTATVPTNIVVTQTNYESFITFDGVDDYIDFDFTPVQTDVIEWRGRYLSLRDMRWGLNDALNHRMYFGIQPGGTDYIFGWGDGANIGGAPDTDVHTFRMDNGIMYIDGAILLDATARTFSGEPTTPWAIGAIHNSGLPASYVDFELQWLSINGTNVYTATDGGLLQESTDTLYTNDGTGTIVLSTNTTTSTESIYVVEEITAYLISE